VPEKDDEVGYYKYFKPEGWGSVKGDVVGTGKMAKCRRTTANGSVLTNRSS
jgi:hypothetical protein